jgi:hypothetical protein
MQPSTLKAIRALDLNESDLYGQVPKKNLLCTVEIAPNDYNPKTCPPVRLLQIARALKQMGWVPSEMPLVWRDPEGTAPFTLINGEHRWQVIAAAGLLHFPALVAENVTSREEAMALTMALEDAKARRDSGKFAENLATLAASGDRDELLRQVFLIRDPEALRQKRAAFASGLAQKAQAAATQAPPKLVSLVFTGAQYEAFQVALRGAKSRLKQAQETVGMVKELADKEIVAIAAVLRNGESQQE